MSLHPDRPVPPPVPALAPRTGGTAVPTSAGGTAGSAPTTHTTGVRAPALEVLA